MKDNKLEVGDEVFITKQNRWTRFCSYEYGKVVRVTKQ